MRGRRPGAFPRDVEIVPVGHNRDFPLNARHRRGIPLAVRHAAVQVKRQHNLFEAVVAVEVTSSAIGDAPVLPDLLDQISPQEKIARVTADGAYDTRACHDAIAARGAIAIIPPRKNARLWQPTTDGAKARNDALRASKRLGRALWRKWSGYHRRSRVEAKMNCIKQLGQRLMAKAFDRQVAEVQIRAAILNRFTALGTPATARVA